MSTSTLEDSLLGFSKVAEVRRDSGYDELERLMAARKGQAVIKHAFDCFVALLLMAAFSPVFVLVALAVKLTSAGPIFFQQAREGRGGRLFMMIKFRSMRTKGVEAAEAQQSELATQGTLLKLQADPRVTAVGRWLRKTSIDELPQLLNVLRGDMSLVGPRPLIPFMLEGHPEFRRARALVRPGITGLWQLRDRINNTTAAAMLPHDVEYLRNFSLKQDMIILAKTIPAVLAGKGAF